jgi:hypothetical protein
MFLSMLYLCYCDWIENPMMTIQLFIGLKKGFLAERGAQILDEVNAVQRRCYHHCSTILDDLDRGNKSGTESMIQNSISVAQGHYFCCKLRSDITRILNGLVLTA